MLSTFGSLQTALRAMNAMQRSIQVSSNNIANAATPGYSRQKTLLVTGEPYSVAGSNRYATFGQVGTGVIAEKIQRFRSGFLDAQIRTENLAFKGWETRRDLLQQIEVIFNEPSETGLNSNINAFWSSWQTLADSPNSIAARSHVAETAQDLSATIREKYRQLKELQAEFDDNVAVQVSQINDLAARIANLNVNIREVQGVGQQPNDLRDQRDQLLTELSGLIEMDAHEAENGSVFVSVGGKLLVMDDINSELMAEPDPTNNMLYRIAWQDTGDAVHIKNVSLEGSLPEEASGLLQGQLGSLLVGRDLIISDYLAQLDDIANTFISSVNALHQTGFGLSANGSSLTSSNTVPGTVDAFSLVPPQSDSSGLSDGTYFLEIRDNANVLEFRLVDSSGNPIAIDDATFAGNDITNNWQALDLVDGTTFDTGRGLAIDFGAIADHQLSSISIDGNINSFGLSSIPQGNAELPTDTHFVEMRDNDGSWEFRFVDSNGDPVEVKDLTSIDESLTAGWQPVPNSNTFDSGRGISIQFTTGPYEESVRGGSVAPPPFPAANVNYTARGTKVGMLGGSAASVSIGNFFSGKGAVDINVSDYIKSDLHRIVTASSTASPGDGSVALEIARLKDKTLLNENSITINNYFRSLITKLGQHSEQASIMTDNQELLVQHLENRQSEFAGVSLDEETVHLLQYQRTYQAAARVMTTVDEMLEKIINGMGLVGR